MEVLRATQESRMYAAIIAVAVCVILLAALWVTPSQRGVGTHHQLGLPTCGWIVAADIPCPTCGMTTSFAHAVRGHFLQSLFAQPMGLVLAIGTLLTGVIAIFTAVTGRSLALIWMPFCARKYIILLGIFALLAWGFKILAYRGVF